MTSTGHTMPASQHGKTRNGGAYSAAARHSTRVRWAKIGLPVAGLAAAAVFAGFTVFARPDLPDNIAVDLTQTAVTDGKIVMANPRMSGFTKDDRPYEMEAERAIQDVTKRTEIALENIKATVPFSGDTPARILAETALFNDESQTLDIDKPFTVTSPDGLKALFESAFVDIANGNFETDRPVDITMNGTRIKAQSMRVTDRGKVMVFENKVSLNIDPASANSTSGTGELRQSVGE